MPSTFDEGSAQREDTRGFAICKHRDTPTDPKYPWHCRTDGVPLSLFGQRPVNTRLTIRRPYPRGEAVSEITVQVPIGEPLISLPDHLPIGWYDIVAIRTMADHDEYTLTMREAKEQVA